MGYNEFMNAIRHWDNLTAKWLLRHFYFTFFQIILVLIFILWFVNTLNVIDLKNQVDPNQTLEKILLTQSVNSTLIVVLLLLNSFWLLFIFRGFQRVITLLRDMNHNLNRMRSKPKP